MATQTYTQIELLSANGTVLRRVSTAPPRLPTNDEIPIIDLAPIDGTLDERKALTSRIKAASENTGFFYIRNHRIPEELIQTSLSQAKTFFDQPLSEKMKIDSSASNVSSGYHGVGSTQVNRTETRGKSFAQRSLFLANIRSQISAFLLSRSANEKTTLTMSPVIRVQMHSISIIREYQMLRPTQISTLALDHTLTSNVSLFSGRTTPAACRYCLLRMSGLTPAQLKEHS